MTEPRLTGCTGCCSPGNKIENDAPDTGAELLARQRTDDETLRLNTERPLSIAAFLRRLNHDAHRSP